MTGCSLKLDYAQYLWLWVELGEEGAEPEPRCGGDALHVAAAAAVEQHHLSINLLTCIYCGTSIGNKQQHNNENLILTNFLNFYGQ